MPVIATPELPRLIVNGSGNYKYVFTYQNHWDKDSKRAKRGKGDTQSVGRFVLDKNKPDMGEIVFNEEFKEKYPALEHLRVFRHKGGKLEFKPIDEELHNLIKPGEIVKLHGGATWALNQIVSETPLGRALKAVFPEYKAYLRILSLVYFIVVTEQRTLSNYEEFAECTWLPYGRGMTSGAVSRLLGKITQTKISKFLTKLNEEYQRDAGDSIVEQRYLALDSTSITSYSENIASVDWGKNKDLIEAPQTNVLLIVDQKTGAPVYYRNFDGNVPDIMTVRNTLAGLALHKIPTENVILVADRGYGSVSNFEDMFRNDMSFVFNTRRNICSAITDVVDEHYAELLDWNHGLSFIKQNAVTVPLNWRYDRFPVPGKKKQNKDVVKVYVHIYYNKAINDEAALRLKTQLTAAVTADATQPDKLTAAQKKLINKYTTVDGDKRKISMKAVDETLRYAGVRVLVSDAISDAQECAVAYEERNQVEYAFNRLKAELNCNRTGVHSTRNWDGKLFLEILATAVLGMVRARVKLYNETASANKKAYRVHYDSDHKLLAKLNNVYMTRFDAGFMFDEIAGKRKELFKILNVPVPSVEQLVTQEAAADEPAPPDEVEALSEAVAADDTEDL